MSLAIAAGATVTAMGSMCDRRGDGALERMLDRAARGIDRWLAPEAFAAAAAREALMIDIRGEEARHAGGVIPGSVHIPRTVLEWRVAIDSPWRNPHIGGLERRLILICDHGYSSVLAARALVDLGFDWAGDVIGGFEAWCAGGLPTQPPRPRARESDQLPGMAAPEPPRARPAGGL
jgi:rhodanese-related sulfurtransferase